jgi:putative tricarboxylic transport membrane protein
MALDRWIALVLLVICVAYGYTAWFGMDDALPPFMRRNPVWPSSFPKILSIAGAACALFILVMQKAPGAPAEGEIDYRRLFDYKIGQAGALVGMMILYALTLNPIGFLAATTLFLAGGGFVLGERRLWLLIPVAAFAAGSIWWLVQEVLGIFLRPLPAML